MNAHSFIGYSADDVHAGLDPLSESDFTPTLALLFGSKVALNLSEIASAFASRGIDVFGISSASEIMSDGTSDDSVFDESCACLLLDVARSHYAIEIFDGSGLSSYTLGEKVGMWASQTFERPALLIGSSGMTADGEQVTKGILSKFDKPIPIFGGLAGDDLELRETLVFSGNNSTTHGTICLLFNADYISVRGVAASGWQPIGAPKRITKSEGNIVYEIDGVPIIDAYERYLGGMNNQNTNSALAASNYPLQLIRPEGYSVLRAGLVVDTEHNAIIYGGTVPEGSTVRFSAPPGTTIIKAAQQAMEAFHSRQPKADALVLFSCKGRHNALGPAIEDEIEYFQHLWNVPLAGYCSYGEIGYNEEGYCDYYNNTCVLVTLTEHISTD
jgi:hypothetical protein